MQALQPAVKRRPGRPKKQVPPVAGLEGLTEPLQGGAASVVEWPAVPTVVAATPALPKKRGRPGRPRKQSLTPEEEDSEEQPSMKKPNLRPGNGKIAAALAAAAAEEEAAVATGYGAVGDWLKAEENGHAAPEAPATRPTAKPRHRRKGSTPTLAPSSG